MMLFSYHRKCKAQVLLFFTSVFCAVFCDGTSYAQQRGDTLTLATYTYSTNNRLQNIAPLAAFLERQLQRPVRTLSFPDPPSLANAVKSGVVDIAVMNTFGYLLLAASPNEKGLPVATFRIATGQSSNYRTIVLSRNGLEITSKAWLRKNSKTLAVAFVSPGSTTGNLIPRLYFASQGIADAENAFARVVYAGTHAEALSLVRAGKVDIAALASEVYENSPHDSSQPVQKLTTLWTSPDIKLGPVVVKSSLSVSERKAIIKQLVGIERTAPEAFTALRDGWTEAKLADALVPTTDRYYDDVRRMFGNPKTSAILIKKFAR
ncbi:MAG: phosphate/phosphite/phosphonate ABC transporter substrate-binding protein [Ignavibacteria bacterium]|nr:phosphate/phosphite/phosphonate ABC transporter substrate-binding protein [Ignavibacteria bacterium]